MVKSKGEHFGSRVFTLSRRNLLKGVFTGLALSSLTPSKALSRQKESLLKGAWKETMKKAVNRWAFPSNVDLKSACSLLKEAGFDGIELNMADQGELTPDTSETEVKRLLDIVKGEGLRVSSVCTGMLWNTPLTSPDAGVVQRGKTVVRKMLQSAQWLETDTILVVPGVVTSEISYDIAYQRALSAVRELAEEAERLKVHIGIENVWNKFLLSPLEMVRFIDEVGSDYVGAYFDVGNVLVFGYPEQWIRLLGKRIRRIHLKDFKTSVGNIQGFCNLLEGDVNWPAVRSALVEIGYDSWVTAELGPYRHYPDQTIRDIGNAIDRWLTDEKEG